MLAGCTATQVRPGQEVDRAVATVRAYSKAIVELDVEAMGRLSHPILILRDGGLEPFKEGQAAMFANFRESGWLESGSEVLGTPSEMFVDGKTLMIGVPAIRRSQKMATTPLVYVATSYDAGQTWSILGLSCTDEHWLVGMAPSYKGDPDILGKDNPAALASLSGPNIDEALFLRGTHWR
jgi:hypothetical protein